jgi:thiol-disulfide isomerase/thioredoxin
MGGSGRIAFVLLACWLAIGAGCDIRDEVLPHAGAQRVSINGSLAEPSSPERNPSGHIDPVWQPAGRPSTTTWARPQSPEVRSAPAAMKQVVRGNLRFIEGFQGGLSEAHAGAKPMLVFFTAEWCHYCHAMEADAFHDPRVVNLSKRFVCVLVDADAEEAVCKRYGIEGFPTVLFLSPRGQVLARLEGKQAPTELLQGMHQAFQSLARVDRSDVSVE